MDEVKTCRTQLDVPVVACGRMAKELVDTLSGEGLLGRMASGGIVAKEGWGGFLPFPDPGGFHEGVPTHGFATVVVADGGAGRDELGRVVDAARRRGNVVIGAGLDAASAAWLEERCDNVLSRSPEDPGQVSALVRFLWSYLFSPSMVGVDIADLKPLLAKGKGLAMGTGRCDGPERLGEAGLEAAALAGVDASTPAVAFAVVTPDEASLADVDACASAVADALDGRTDILFCWPLGGAPAWEVVMLAVVPQGGER